MFRVQYSLELREDPSSKGWKEAQGEVVASLIVSKFETSRLRFFYSGFLLSIHKYENT